MPVLQRPAEHRFAGIVERQTGRLHALAYRVTGDHGSAEEVVQDSFAKLAASAVLQRPDGEVTAWLRRVTLNGAFNRARDERRARERVDRAARLEPAAQADDTALGAVLLAEERARVRAALARLSERQQAVLLLRASGYRYAEIAATLEIATGSVGVLLARAEQAFRRCYAPPGTGPGGGATHEGEDR